MVWNFISQKWVNDMNFTSRQSNEKFENKNNCKSIDSFKFSMIQYK